MIFGGALRCGQQKTTTFENDSSPSVYREVKTADECILHPHMLSQVEALRNPALMGTAKVPSDSMG